MLEVPSLPPPGPVRVIAIAGTLGLIGFASALVERAVRRAGREIVWAATPLALGLAAVACARLAPGLHAVVSLGALAVGARNVARWTAAGRWLALVGLLGWAAALVTGRLLFRPG